MAGLTDTNFAQPPRRDLPPTDPGDLKEVNQTLDAFLKWAETIRRRLGRVIPHYHPGSAVFNPPNLVAGAGATTTVTVTGAALGDAVLVSFSLDLQGITLTGWVSALDTISVRFQNGTAGALDLASGTIKAWAYIPPSVA